MNAHTSPRVRWLVAKRALAGALAALTLVAVGLVPAEANAQRKQDGQNTCFQPDSPDACQP